MTATVSQLMKTFTTKEKLFLFAIFLMLFVGIFIRLYQFEGFTTFLGDQGRDAVKMKNIITFKDFPHEGAPSSIGTVKLGAFYYYLMASFLPLFGFNPTGIAYGIFILSTIGILAAYFVIKKEVNFNTALLFLFFSLFAYHLVDISRFSWNPNLLPFFAFFTLYFAYGVFKYKHTVDALMFGLLFGASTQLHPLAFLLGLPVLFVTIYVFIKTKHRRELIANLIISKLSFLLIYAHFLFKEFQNDFPNITKLIDLFTSKEFLGEKKPWIERFLQTNQSLWQTVFKMDIAPYVALSMLFIFIVVVIFAIKRVKPNLFVILNVLNIFSYIVGFSLLQADRHPHYYESIYLSVFFIFAFLLSLIPQRTAKYAITLGVVLIFLWINFPKYYFLYDKPHNQVKKAKIIADSFKGRTLNEPIRLAVLPATETHDQYRYFIDIEGVRILSYSSKEPTPNELYVICIDPNCAPVDDAIWPIASFENKKLMDNWKVGEITIHRIIHEEKSNSSSL